MRWRWIWRWRRICSVLLPYAIPHPRYAPHQKAMRRDRAASRSHQDYGGEERERPVPPPERDKTALARTAPAADARRAEAATSRRRVATTWVAVEEKRQAPRARCRGATGRASEASASPSGHASRA